LERSESFELGQLLRGTERSIHIEGYIETLVDVSGTSSSEVSVGTRRRGRWRRSGDGTRRSDRIGSEEVFLGRGEVELGCRERVPRREESRSFFQGISEGEEGGNDQFAQFCENKENQRRFSVKIFSSRYTG
jgi:hypothetical protein